MLSNGSSGTPSNTVPATAAVSLDWQLVASRIARLGDGVLLQLPDGENALSQFYGDGSGGGGSGGGGGGGRRSAEWSQPLVPQLADRARIAEWIGAALRAGEAVGDHAVTAGIDSEPRPKRPRSDAQPRAISEKEVLSLLRGEAQGEWIAQVVAQVDLFAHDLVLERQVLPQAAALQMTHQQQVQMGAFIGREVPPPHPLLPIVVRCGLELGHKADVFALLLGCLATYPLEEPGGAAEHGTKSPLHVDVHFARQVAAQVVEAVLAAFTTALKDMAAGVASQAMLFGSALAPTALASATTALFGSLPAVLRARRALRFLAELANVHVIDPEWFVRQLLVESLVEPAAFGAEQDCAPLARSQCLIGLALDALVRCGREAERVTSEAVDRILAAAERFAGGARSAADTVQTCQQMERLLSPVAGGDTADADVAPELRTTRRLVELLAACKQLRRRAWHCALLPQYYRLLADERLHSRGPRLHYRAWPMPRHSIDARYPPPEFVLQVLAHRSTADEWRVRALPSAASTDADEATPAPVHAVSRAEMLLMRERLLDVLDAFAAERALCSRVLRQAPPGVDPVCHDVAVVELLLGGMLELPRSRRPLLFYATLLIDLCRRGEAHLAARLLQAVDVMVAQASRLDAEAADRLAEWFAYHLSHFSWRWRWSAWSDCTSDMHRCALVITVLERAVRLAYRERLAELLPPEMHPLLVPEPEPALDDATTEAPEAMAVETALAQRLAESSYDVMPFLAERVPGEQRLRVFLRAMLRSGYRAPSFFAALVDAWGATLLSLRHAGGSRAPADMVQVVLACWRDAHQSALITLDKLCNAGVAERDTVVAGAFRHTAAQMSAAAAAAAAGRHALVELRFPFEVVRHYEQQLLTRIEFTQRDIQHLASRASSAAERDAERLAEQLEVTRRTLETYRQLLKRLLLAAVDQATSVAVLPPDSPAELQQWYRERTRGLVRELLRRHAPLAAKLLPSVRALLSSSRADERLQQDLQDVEASTHWALSSR
ncbi:hypothetical protein CDCA_CDCA09G2760 [Cyanidium caldarium]|uniref:Nuclear cap-binding protein subunit 1 n=1 Tax=Cyanidium caldarium TaxID=2771 RepID=A0AAV9IWN4_CYACA|nr:hypothetical protein CDCA_CDCA09G2760 [Cyanidium caldarium]